MTAILTLENPAYFDRLADIEARHWWSRGMWSLSAHWLRRALQGRTGLRALDVGCGTGMTARRLATLTEVGSVVGIDPSTAALAYARRRHAGSFVQGSLPDLPFSSNEFDVVTCFDVIQHVAPHRIDRSIRELARMLTPGGVLLVRSNGRGWSGDESAFQLRDLAERLEGGGFRIHRASYANMLPALVQELRGWFRRGLDSSSHPAGGGLRIQVPPDPVNRLMRGVSVSEAWAVGRMSVCLPFGHSTMVWAERSG